MTTQEPQTPVTEPVAEPAAEAAGDSNPQLREARDRAIERAEKAEKQLVGVHLADIGLNPTEGLGIAIADTFKGEPTLENISAHATDKYKYTYDPATQGQIAGQPVTRAEQVASAEVNVGQQVMGVAQSVQPDDEAVAQMNVVDRKLSEGETATTQEIASGIAAKMNLARG
jgi:hypothetical protein